MAGLEWVDMVGWTRGGLSALALAAGATAPAGAEELPVPRGEIILTVTGDIGATNLGDSAVFDIDMLRDLGETSFETTTPWTDGVQSFSGVSLWALTRVLDVTGGTMKATAINDYAISIPMTDAIEGGPILAYTRNGAPMSVREKGPLWLVYPYDLQEAYQAEVIFSRSIWQLDRLHVLTD